jgi:hypothetical protein
LNGKAVYAGHQECSWKYWHHIKIFSTLQTGGKSIKKFVERYKE